jgi:uncharacterized membrane protein
MMKSAKNMKQLHLPNHFGCQNAPKRWPVLAALAFSIIATETLAQTYTITDLGTLGAPYSAAYRINDIGQVVVSSSQYPDNGTALLWTPSSRNAPTGAFASLGMEVEFPYVAINGHGQVLLKYRFWTPLIPNGTNGTPTYLETPGSTSYSLGFGMNDAGVVVGFAYGKPPRDCRDICVPPRYPTFWESGQGHLLDHDEGVATAINNAGQVVGTKVWQPNGQVAQLTPPPPGTLIGINDFGQIIGSFFLWTPNTANGSAGQLTDLGLNALDINGRGQVVGYSGSEHALLWSPTRPNGASGSMTDLNTLLPSGSGWVLRRAYGINDVGQIVGVGAKPSGLYSAYLLTPVSFPRLSTPSVEAGGQIRFTLMAEAGRSYTIQGSTNLMNWMALTNFVSATGTNQFIDPAAPSFSRRFYRAVSP